MIKCIPVISSIDGNKISFHISIVDANISMDTIHTMYGGGQGYPGRKIGEASAILQDCNRTLIYDDNNINVLYLAGYRDDGKDFCVETEKSIVEACKTAAKVFWG